MVVRRGRGPADDGGDDAEPGVVVDAGDDLRLTTVGQLDAADDVHLPELHRPAAFPSPLVLPPTPARRRIDQAVPDQHPMHGDPRRDRPGAVTTAKLKEQATGTPSRVVPAQLTDERLHLRSSLARRGTWPAGPVRKPFQALVLIPGQPTMHRLAGDPESFCDVRDRGSGQHVLDGSIPLFHHAHLHQHSAECHPGPDTDVSRRSRDRTPAWILARENFPYVFKAALRAARPPPSPAVRASPLRSRRGPAVATARPVDTPRPRPSSLEVTGAERGTNDPRRGHSYPGASRATATLAP